MSTSKQNFKNKKYATNKSPSLVPSDNFLNCVGEAIIITDTRGRVHFINDAAIELVCQTRQKIMDNPLVNNVILFDEIIDQIVDPVNQCITENKTIVLSSSYCLIRLDGTQVPIQGSIAPLYEINSEPHGAILVMHNDTQRNVIRRFIGFKTENYAAHIITWEILENRIQQHNTEKHLHKQVLLYVALNRIDNIIETYGTSAMSVCLKQITKLIHLRIRERDSIIQFDNHDFGVLLEYCSDNQALKIALDIIDRIENKVFFWDKIKYSLQASIGIAAIENHINNVESLVANARIASKSAHIDKFKHVKLYQDQYNVIQISKFF